MAENLDIEKCFMEIDNSYTEFLEFASGMIQIPSVNPPGDYEGISQFVYIPPHCGEGLMPSKKPKKLWLLSEKYKKF